MRSFHSPCNRSLVAPAKFQSLRSQIVGSTTNIHDACWRALFNSPAIAAGHP